MASGRAGPGNRARDGKPLPLRRYGAGSRAPLHPGHFLATRFMAPLGISQQKLAQDLGISRRRVNELIRGHRGITPDTAIRLAVYFSTDANFWMALQNAWDMHLAWRKFTAPNPQDEAAA